MNKIFPTTIVDIVNICFYESVVLYLCQQVITILLIFDCLYKGANKVSEIYLEYVRFASLFVMSCRHIVFQKLVQKLYFPQKYGRNVNDMIGCNEISLYIFLVNC